MPVPCVPDNEIAQKIIASCEAHFAANAADCNQFLKAALADFLAAGYLDGLNADGIVGKLQDPTEAWTTSRAIPTAIAMAKNGHVVIAGMTSAALGQRHGHVAVVVGCDGQMSGTTVVPLGYAGALGNPAAELCGGRLSGTFEAALVRAGRIDYYFKPPDRTPV